MEGVEDRVWGKVVGGVERDVLKEMGEWGVVVVLKDSREFVGNIEMEVVVGILIMRDIVCKWVMEFRYCELVVEG